MGQSEETWRHDDKRESDVRHKRQADGLSATIRRVATGDAATAIAREEFRMKKVKGIAHLIPY